MNKSFLKATEVWTPTNERTELEWVAGTHAGLSNFHHVSQATRFAFGEGLPGRAWALRRPLVMKTDSEAFLRRSAAKAAGITTAIALPVFAGDCLTGVIVFLCGDDAENVGAIEVWHCDTASSYDMKLAHGYFGQLEHFEAISRVTAFRKGTGLPGQVWESGMPVIMSDLGRSHRFVRFEGAQESGITTGVGIPFFGSEPHAFVMTFLSAKNTPIARTMEIWVPKASRDGLALLSRHAEGGGDSSGGAKEVTLTPGPLGRAFLTGRPGVYTRDANSVWPSDSMALSVVPVIESGRVKAVLALYV